MPLDVSDFGWITADIRRDTTFQNVSYVEWKLGANEYTGASSSYISRQQENLKALTPLLNWAQSIRTTQLSEIEAIPGMCN